MPWGLSHWHGPRHASGGIPPEPRPRRRPSTRASGRQARAGGDGTVRSSRPDRTPYPRNSWPVTHSFRRRQDLAVTEEHRRARDDDARTGFPVSESVFDGGVNSRGGDGESQADQRSPSPAVDDLFAI